MKPYCRTFILICFFVGVLTSSVQAQTGTTVTLYVNAQHAQASDTNPGTVALPLKTVSKAATMALANNKDNIGTIVRIAPGTYRESLALNATNTETDAPITVEAIETGKVIISGSDVYTGWVKEGINNIYTRAWPHKWGLAPYPSGWESMGVTLQPMVRRREMVIVNGILYNQVLSYDELHAGAFYVDETANKVYIWVITGTNMAYATVEVATRSGLLKVEGKSNLTIKGIVFQHDNTPIQGSAATVDGSDNVLLEDNRFVWNNWGGLSITLSEGVTLRRNVASHNGGVGLGAWKVIDLVAENNATNYNNWRGAKGGFVGWATAGMKVLHIHGATIRGQQVVGNYSNGLWFDTGCSNISIEQSLMSENYALGVFLEANQGPFVIKDSAVCHNQKGAGIMISNTSDGRLENNLFYANNENQILVSGEYEGYREFQDWETGQTHQVKSQRWTLKNNTVVGVNYGPMVLSTTLSAASWKLFTDSLYSDRNIWFHPNRTIVFQGSGGGQMDLKGWKLATGRDLYSSFTNPVFISPTKYDACRLPINK